MPRERSKHDPYAAFRVPNFCLYTLGSLITIIGTQVQSIAIGWEIYERTGDELALGLVGLVQAAPMIVLALPAGHLADVFNRRNIIMLSAAGATLTSLCLASLSYWQGPTYLMYLLLLVDATVLSVGRPARMALLPQLVPTDVFPNAVTWRTSTFQMASVVGPALGGLIVALSVPLAYVIAASSTVLFIGMLIPLKPRPVAAPDGPRQSYVRQLFGGVHYLWHKRLLLTIISLDMFAVLLGGAVYLLPIFAKDILEVGATGFGWLRAAPAAGAFLMALLLAHMPPMRKAGRNLLLAVAGFGLATIVFGLSRSFWLSLAMLFLTGVLDNVSVVIRGTLIQLLTPDHMRGRISAVNSVFIGTSNELGGLESGVVAKLFTPVISVVSGGVGTILVVATTAIASPRLRRLGPLHETTPEEHTPSTSEKTTAATAEQPD